MLKGTDLVGRLVVSYDTGEKVTRVRDLIFDQDSDRLLGFLVDEGGWFRSAKVIPFESIKAIGVSAVVIPSRDSIVSASTAPRIQQLIKIDNILKGTRLMAVSGRDLGTIVDLYFDDRTGKVEGYEASGGLFADAYSGRSFVPAPQTLKIGEDIAFVPEETASLMEEQVGGIKGAMQAAGDKIQETSDSAGQKLEVVGEKLQEGAIAADRKLQAVGATSSQKLQQAARAAAASITNTLVDPSAQKVSVIGKVAKQEVVTANGLVIVQKEGVVTSAIADLAEQCGELDRLYRATGGDMTVEVNAKLQNTRDVTGSKLAEIASIVTNRLNTTDGYTGVKFNDFVRSTTAALTDAVVDPQEQKALIIGRVADRTVTAPDGKLIALEGQQVTYYMTVLAEEKGVLDQLFRAAGGSVTKELSGATDRLLSNMMLEQAVGRRIYKPVWAENGSALAVSGQIVTQSLVDRVRDTGKQAQLLDAVGLTPDMAFRESGERTLTATGDRLQQGAVDLKEQASSFWETVKQKVAEYSHKASETLEDRKIKNALGRPVNRVIFDRQDRVILKVGELVTHRAIERARQADSLDILLSSVQAPNSGYPAPQASGNGSNRLHVPVQGELILNGKG